MNEILQMFLNNIVPIGIILGIGYAAYWIFSRTDEDTNIIEAILKRQHLLIEFGLAGVALLEAYIASKVGNHGSDMQGSRFANHFALAIISMIFGFGVAKQSSQFLKQFIELSVNSLPYLWKVQLGKIAGNLISVSFQAIQVLLVAVMTLAGPLGNWYLIGESQGDDLSALLTLDFMTVYQNLHSYQLWTKSSGIVCLAHVVGVGYLGLIAFDDIKFDFSPYKELFSKKSSKGCVSEIARDLTEQERSFLKRQATNAIPKDFKNVTSYVKANTKISFSDISKLTEIESIKFVVKDILTKLVNLAIYAREVGDADNHIRLHKEIENYVECMLKNHCSTIPLKDRAEETKEKFKKEIEEQKEKENKEKHDSISDRDSERKRDHSESDDDEDVDKEEESGDD
jgi:hypothetical protein